MSTAEPREDATERSVATEEAGVPEQSLAALISNLPGMVYRCKNDSAWTMELVSAGCQDLTGYASHELLGNKVVSYAGIIFAEDQGAVWEQVQAALARRAPFTLKYRIRTKAGEEKHVYEKGRGAFGENGALLALEGFVMDITAHVHAERELAEKSLIIEAQRDAIRNLSTPIIEVWDGVLTLPIVGALHGSRVADMTQALLDAVSRRRASRAILDLTGVEAMDPATAAHIVLMIRAVELLGARGVIVGIRPEVAQTLASLNVDLGSVVTLSNLREALLACIAKRI